MIIRQLKSVQFERINQELKQKALAKPFEASYTVNMTVNNISYELKLQPEKHCKLAVLQALEIDRNENHHKCELITNTNLLSALLEILIYQGVK